MLTDWDEFISLVPILKKLMVKVESNESEPIAVE